MESICFLQPGQVHFLIGWGGSGSGQTPASSPVVFFGLSLRLVLLGLTPLLSRKIVCFRGEI